MSTINGDAALDGKHGVQAAETVLQVLSGFIGAEPMPMLKTLAERIDMHPAKVHRYLVSLSRMGYVEQDRETSRYRLGPLSLRLGFAAMASVDVLRVARPLMFGFCQTLGYSVLLGIWNDNGPTIALKEAPPGPLTITASEGAALPILRSAIGRVFGAWTPRSKTATLVAQELKELRARPVPGCPASQEEVEALFQEIRKRGLVRVTGQLSPAMYAFAAPVFNSASELVAALCVAGPPATFDSTWASPTGAGLLQAAALVSRGLGYEPRA